MRHRALRFDPVPREGVEFCRDRLSVALTLIYSWFNLSVGLSCDHENFRQSDTTEERGRHLLHVRLFRL